MTALLAILLLGCAKDEQPRSTITLAMPTRASVPIPDPGPPVEPGQWRDEATGLGLRVPEGWSGRQGPDGATLRLWVEQEVTGVSVEVWAFERSGPPTPRPRPGCERVFRDPLGLHGGIPALGSATIATCQPHSADGPLIQGWYGALDQHEVHVEAGFPPGTAFSARADVEELVATLTWRP